VSFARVMIRDAFVAMRKVDHEQNEFSDFGHSVRSLAPTKSQPCQVTVSSHVREAPVYMYTCANIKATGSFTGERFKDDIITKLIYIPTFCRFCIVTRLVNISISREKEMGRKLDRHNEVMQSKKAKETEK